MFQRKQSLLIIIAIVIEVLGLTMTLGSSEDGILNAFHSSISTFDGIASLTGYVGLFSAALMLMILLQYKDRKKQMKLITVAMGTASFTFAYPLSILIKDGHSVAIITWLMIAVPVLLQIARAFIKKDEELIKSVDRIR